MIREAQSTTFSQTFRARDKALIFNNSASARMAATGDGVASLQGFAQTAFVTPCNQLVVVVAHRPASRPGAD
jgi:hypothetical protein